MKAMLIDSTICIGCRACQAACKKKNNLPAEKTKFFSGGEYQNPAKLSAKTWTLISFNYIQDKSMQDWIFTKKQCFHCIEPACVKACPESAISKSKTGPVIYDSKLCVGCRSCAEACPFGIPSFEWDEPESKMQKCTFCVDNIEMGKEPACAKTCPTNAILFGEREELIKEAERRISTNPKKYVKYIYGKTEVGGTSILHLAGVSFDKMGFDTKLPKTAALGNANFAALGIPYSMLGLGIALKGFNWIVERRNKNVQNQYTDN